MVCAKFQIPIMKYTVFVNGLNNYSKWPLDAILNILDLASLVDLDKFTNSHELMSSLWFLNVYDKFHFL